MRKIAWICFLLIISSVIGFTACGEGKYNNELESFEKLLEEMTNNSDDVVEAQPFADRVYIIIPGDASAELKARADGLSDSILNKTQIEAIVKYDYEDILADDDDLCVLVGNTDRMASEEVTADLRRGDYICKWYNGEIVIAARDDEAAVIAIDKFVETVLPGASNASLMSEGAHFEHREEYDVGAVTVNKYDLYDYTFVCTDEAQEMVTVLSQYIAQKSGYLVKVSTDVRDAKGKKISFCYDKSVSGLLIDRVGQDIRVLGADEYGLSMAIVEFANRLFGNVSDEGVANMDVSEKYEISFENKKLRVCSAYYLNQGAASREQITQNAETIQTKGFDIVFYGDIDQESYNDISFNLKSVPDYDVINISDESGRIFCAVYKKDSFDNIAFRLEGGALVVDAAIVGERFARRIIWLEDMDAQELSGLFGEISYDMLLLNGATPEGLCQVLSVDNVAEHSWSFGESEYLCSVFTEASLMTKGEATVDKDYGKGYMNLYLYTDVSAKSSAEFEALKNTLE